MNFTKNLFIIGAGALVPYGMPTGNDFKKILRRMNYRNLKNLLLTGGRELTSNEIDNINRKITSLIKENKGILNGQENPNFENELLKKFINDFLDTGDKTIDEFLSGLDEDSQRIGKIILVIVLEYFLERDPLRGGKDNDDWIEKLLLIIFPYENKDFLKPEYTPKFIIFNYDSLFELSIYRRLKVKFQWEDCKIKEFLKKMEIVHVYGSIPILDYLIDDKLPNSNKNLLLKADTLRIIQRNNPKNVPHLEQIRKYLKSAERILFLGFGFDFTNLEILFGENKGLFGNKIYATNIGMQDDPNGIEKERYLHQEKMLLTQYPERDSLKLLDQVILLKESLTSREEVLNF